MRINIAPLAVATGALIMIIGAGAKEKLPDGFVPSDDGGIKVDWSDEKSLGNSVSKTIDKPEFSFEKNGSFLEVAHHDNTGEAKLNNGKVELAAGNRTHRFYTIKDGFEYEIEYQTRPASNIEVLDLQMSDDFDFFYQPPLTKKELNEGKFRPENVVGSYAVYWKKPGDIKDENGNFLQRHGTGKFMHIYRPQLIDANGDKIWAEMEIDPIAKTLTITMPGDWLDNAVYPVILDPTFGNTNIGGSNDTTPGNFMISLGTESPASNGTIDSMSLYTRATTSGRKFTAGGYSNSSGTPGSRLWQSAEGTSVSGGWVTVTVSGSPAVTGGTAYWLAFDSDAGTLNLSYDATGGYTNKYVASTYSAGSLPDPYPGSPSTATSYRLSIYATYTATVAAVPKAHFISIE